MGTAEVATFESLLSRDDVPSTVVSPDGFSERLRDLIEPPAIGTALPFDDVSLSNLPVTLKPSAAALRDARTGMTGTRLGIASLGTVLVESRSDGEELVSLYPELHIVVVRSSDIRPDLESAFSWLSDAFEAGHESFVLATGPSSTGDMGALVQGVHGPERVHIVILQDNE